MIRLGLDFDNTLIFYDDIFHKIASEKKLIPNVFPAQKKKIRDFLIANNLEDQFTHIQAEVYGKRIIEAKPCKNLIKNLKKIKDKNIDIYIVSHKTIYPYKGPKYNLHNAAEEWLIKNGFFDKSILGFSRKNIFFETTKIDKISRIKNLGCTHFIDDLPEILNMINEGCIKILYDPNSINKVNKFNILKDWDNLESLLK